MAEQIIDIVTIFLVLLSAALTFTAGIGVLRFPDLMSRQHAAAKPQTLGIISMAIAVGLQNPDIGVITLLILMIAFQMFTQPVSTHMLSRSGYRTKHLKPELLVIDELAAEIDRAEAREQQMRLEQEALQEQDAQRVRKSGENSSENNREESNEDNSQ